MICKRCGRNNSPNAKRCANCGAPLSYGREKQKQTEGIIVACIILLVLLLVLVAGVYIYKDGKPTMGSFGGGGGGGGAGGGGGGSLPPPSFAIGGTSSPDFYPEEEPDETYEPSYTQTPSARDRRLAKKNKFLDKAAEIEEYSREYLETAVTQSSMNSESYTVYKKWDDLLNEVYQYLESIMSYSEFERLEDDEAIWIAEKENAINEAGAEWEGGTGEAFARNTTAIVYTEERCYYLISLIN